MTRHDDDLEPLAGALRRLGQSLETQQPPATLREALLARAAPAPARVPVLAGAASRGAWPWRRTAPWLAMGGLLLALAALWRPPAAAPRAPSPFIAVGEGQRDTSPAWVVAAELPRERLAEFGLPFDPARAGESVRAELLLRGDGEVLAVRLLPQQ